LVEQIHEPSIDDIYISVNTGSQDQSS